MIKRELDKLGIELPLLGFGCMRLPEKDKQIDREHAQRMVDYAMANGINYFDTALMYHQHTSEDFMGQALAKYPRESYYLTTKIHIDFAPTIEEVEKLFEEQLKKCKTDYFDFYLIHDVDRTKLPRFKEMGLYDFLKCKQNEGKVKYIGFSFHDQAEQLDEMLKTYNYGFDFVQLQINYLDWELRNAKACYEVLERAGIPCVVMEPVKGGMLADVPENVAKIFSDYSNKYTPALWALRWVASLPNVKMVLSGMSSMEQLVENDKMFSAFEPLTSDEYKVVDEVFKALTDVPTLPCTGCRYCTECSIGVDIPGIFNMYNRIQIAGNREKFRIRNTFEKFMTDNQKPEACIECGQCETLCPQHIHIIDELKMCDEVIKKYLG